MSRRSLAETAREDAFEEAAKSYFEEIEGTLKDAVAHKRDPRPSFSIFAKVVRERSVKLLPEKLKELKDHTFQRSLPEEVVVQVNDYSPDEDPVLSALAIQSLYKWKKKLDEAFKNEIRTVMDSMVHEYKRKFIKCVESKFFCNLARPTGLSTWAIPAFPIEMRTVPKRFAHVEAGFDLEEYEIPTWILNLRGLGLDKEYDYGRQMYAELKRLNYGNRKFDMEYDVDEKDFLNKGWSKCFETNFDEGAPSIFKCRTTVPKVMEPHPVDRFFQERP